MLSKWLQIATLLMIFSSLAGVAQASSDLSPNWRGNVAQDPHQLSDGTMLNGSWTGYAVTGTGFTYVSGSWTVPTLDCPPSLTTEAAFWVGFDGLNTGSATVEQTGTLSVCDAGQQKNYAWYELLPSPPVYSALTVSAKDQISASVSYKNGTFYFVLTDETTGAAPFKASGALTTAARTTAEWIAEAPTNASTKKLFPLAAFGKGVFGSKGECVAVDSTTAGAISAFGTNVTEVVIGTDKNIAAAPSALSSSGGSFSVDATAINVTNTYGLPGTFYAYIFDSANPSIASFQFQVATSNGSANLFLTGLIKNGSLASGSTYTFELEPYGSSGFGPGFSNFVLTASPNLLFSNGTATDSGLVYAGSGGASVQFTVQ
jgi:hypothetical protein